VIRILVVDDHPIVREGLVAVLEDQPDFQVVGSASSAEEAIRLAPERSPEVVLLDLEMPGMDGVAAIPALQQAAPDTRILVFTAYDTDERVFGALRAGAQGYLLKGAPAEEIARAIRTVYAGGSHLEPRVAARVVAEVGAPRHASGGLSSREREVLGLVAGGLSNKQIARSLGITERTVKFHVTSVFNKLGAENRAQAVAMAIQQGFVKL
jgi:DNA-binding NarL/FixJ family response regulator